MAILLVGNQYVSCWLHPLRHDQRPLLNPFRVLRRHHHPISTLHLVRWLRVWFASYLSSNPKSSFVGAVPGRETSFKKKRGLVVSHINCDKIGVMAAVLSMFVVKNGTQHLGVQGMCTTWTSPPLQCRLECLQILPCCISDGGLCSWTIDQPCRSFHSRSHNAEQHLVEAWGKGPVSVGPRAFHKQ